MSSQRAAGTKSFWQKAILWIYPFLVAYYPIFALRNHNIVYVDVSTIVRSLLLVTAGTALIGTIAYLALRNLEKTSILTSLLVLAFLSYGHFYLQIGDSLGHPIQHRYLVGGELLILLVVTFLIMKNDQVARALSQFLATASVVLLALVVFESARYDLALYRAVSAASGEQAPTAQLQGNQKWPDFYVILLDGHTRSDVLQTRYGYDNSAFVRQLSEMGFYVAGCSQSNYASTKLSLTSAIYGDYIQNIAVDGTLPPLETSPLHQTLESLGYKTLAFENRASGHFDLKEDLRLSRNQMAFGKIDFLGGINEFEKMMVDTSFMRFVVDTELIPGFDKDTLQEWDLREHYSQTNFILTELEKVPEIPGPKFIFAHIMVPHSPYIFAPDGSFKPDVHAISGYRANTEFIDNRLPSVLQAIIEKSDPRPIIIIMGDHGPATRTTITKQMRMATLDAYLVNDAAKAQLYPTLTPINAMRIILNAHYGGAYPRLEDVSYYAYQLPQLDDAETIANDCTPTP
jgi:hypothetical protein